MPPQCKAGKEAKKIHPMFAKKEAKAAAAKPEQKTSDPAASNKETPPSTPQSAEKQKLPSTTQTPDAPPTKKQRMELTSQTEKNDEVIAQAAVDQAKLHKMEVSGVGLGTMWALGGDNYSLGSPGFDPQSRKGEFAPGKPIGFDLLSGALSMIEKLKGSGTGSKKKMTIVLTNAFRVFLHFRPEDLVPAIYFVSNKVAPDYENSELGVGDGLIVKTISEVFGRSQAQINAILGSGEASDLGEVALQSRLAQKMLMKPKKLTMQEVFKDMHLIANAKGSGSSGFRKEKISKMMVASQNEEAKYLVRMLQSKLRIGIQGATVLQAIAYAFVLTRPASVGTDAVSDTRRGPKGLSGGALEEALVLMESAVKQAFCEMPNFDKLLAALFGGHTASSLPTVCHISLGIPVKPMLAKPSKGLAEVTERLEGKAFTAEWKYDGERAQIHIVDRNNVMVYSRNSENMTEKYPDVIEFVKAMLHEDCQSCMIDSEVVAVDNETGRILPFQVLTTRSRKDVQVENIKVQVCIYAFDCMLFNGTPCVKKPLAERRDFLKKCLKSDDKKVKFAEYMDFDEINEERIQSMLDSSIEGSCEGLMLKTLRENASYEPSKRSLNWLKLKKDYLENLGDSIDVVPIGAWYGKGKRTGKYGAFLLAIYDPESEEFQTVCKAGTGFSDKDLEDHYVFFKEHLCAGPESNYNVHDSLKPDVWFEPCQVWEIKAADLSISPVHTSAFGVKADGKGIGLRFPRFLHIRPDKKPEDATSAEQIVDMYASQSSIAKGGGGDDDDDYL